MKDNKAFTLIEVICTLVILGILASLVTLQFMGTIKNSRVSLNAEQKKRLEATAQDITLNNKNCLTKAKDNIDGIRINLPDMKRYGYLSDQSIRDLEEDAELSGCVVVKWNDTYSRFDYEYNEQCLNTIETCEIEAVTEKVIVSSFYAEDGNPQYTNKRSITYYLRYSTAINAEYCVTLGTQANCNWKKLNINATSINGQVNLIAENETNTIHLYIRNSNKNIINSMEDTIYYDTIKPTCSWLNSGNNRVNNGGTLEVTLRCLDTSGISNTELLRSAITINNPTLISLSDAIISSNGLNKDFKFIVGGLEGNGSVTLDYSSSLIKDGAGNVASSASNVKNIVVDNILPTGEISIKNGEMITNRYTNNRNIQLEIKNAIDIDKVCISSTSNYCDNWQPYKNVYDWALTPLDGIKAVYVSFRDSAGNETTKDINIYLDTVAPTCQFSLPLANNLNLKENSYVEYNATCSDTVQIGSYEIKTSDLIVSDNNLAKAEVVNVIGNTYIIRITALKGDGYVSVHLNKDVIKDLAGNYNVQGEITRNLLIDNTPPQNNEIIIGYGSTITNQLNLTVSLSSDINTGYYCISKTNNSDDCTWYNYSHLVSYRIERENGTHTIYAFFKDLAGNISVSGASDSIIYNENAVSCNLIFDNDYVVINSQYASLDTNPYSWDNINWTSSDRKLMGSNENLFRAYIKDNNGNISYCEVSRDTN